MKNTSKVLFICLIALFTLTLSGCSDPEDTNDFNSSEVSTNSEYSTEHELPDDNFDLSEDNNQSKGTATGDKDGVLTSSSTQSSNLSSSKNDEKLSEDGENTSSDVASNESTESGDGTSSDTNSNESSESEDGSVELPFDKW